MTEKGKFIQKFNEAFAKSDTEYLSNNVTDDVHWTMHGDFAVRGKKAFIEALNQMEADEPFELTIKNIITHGNTAAVDGTMKTPSGNKTYAFCDVYKFNGFKNPKIKEMTSYVLEVKE
ncbi:MAG: nuclear transport factor 2 family protein [Balneolales bacterium]